MIQCQQNKCHSQICFFIKNYCFLSELIPLVLSSIPENYSIAIFISLPGLFCLHFSPGKFCLLCVLICLCFHSVFCVWHLSLLFCVLLSFTPCFPSHMYPLTARIPSLIVNRLLCQCRHPLSVKTTPITKFILKNQTLEIQWKQGHSVPSGASSLQGNEAGRRRRCNNDVKIGIMEKMLLGGILHLARFSECKYL